MREIAVLFWFYLAWILFNRTPAFLVHRPMAKWRKSLESFLIQKENDWPALYIVRYQLFSCAFCFCLTTGFFSAIVGASELVWVAMFAVTVFSIETIIKKL